MIKVKGQVSQVAMCLNDTNNEIKDLARSFFLKLSQRSNNPVYNLLSDIIGIFSRGDELTLEQEESARSRKLTNEEFKSTMHFLLSFVQKDK
jgi:condensin complex subunit 1